MRKFELLELNYSGVEEKKKLNLHFVKGKKVFFNEMYYILWKKNIVKKESNPLIESKLSNYN